MNALAAEQKEQRGDSGTIGDILGNAAKSAVTETLGSSSTSSASLVTGCCR
ncbi:hypothetical protein GS485_17420 [Rhodococcus hoagii]|nr:hypothetical protein [Prescottella equi]